MKTTKSILTYLLIILSALLIGCNDRTQLYCNHNNDRDTLSRLDFSRISFETNKLNFTTLKFIIDTTTSAKKINDIHLINLLNNNILINGYLDYRNEFDISRMPGTNYCITKLLIRFNKNTLKLPADLKPMSYEEYHPDSTSLYNDYYLLGRLDLSKKYDSFIVSKLRKIIEIDGIFSQDTSYYLLNIDKYKRLISTAKLAYIKTESDGLSYYREELRVKFFLKRLLFYSQDWYIVALDLLPDRPGNNPVNSHKSKFCLNLKGNGEIK